jgi:hypothetical protein
LPHEDADSTRGSPAKQDGDAVSSSIAILPLANLAECGKLWAKFRRLASPARGPRAQFRPKLRAERKAGQLLAKMDDAKPGRKKIGNSEEPNSVPALEELGISENQSSRWQRLADVPENGLFPLIVVGLDLLLLLHRGLFALDGRG